MKVEIGRQELVALCISIERTGPKRNPGNEWMFELRPFINGDSWRLKPEVINTATDQQLFDLYSTHSETIKLL
jgi:hypothetical protein